MSKLINLLFRWTLHQLIGYGCGCHREVESQRKRGKEMNRTIKKAMTTGIASLMLMASTLPSQAAQVTDFRDVKHTAWYYQAVKYATREGLFAETIPCTFSPEQGMTRAMFVTALGRVAGQTGKSGMASCFTDVDPDTWYGPSVEWAAEQQIVSGVENNRFAPDEPITREQLAVMLMKYVRNVGGEISFSVSMLNRFTDSDKVSSFAREAMAWAVSHGILSGADGKLLPQGTATRAQTAQMLMNAKDLLTKVASNTVAHNPLYEETEAGESTELREIRAYLQQMLPSSCRWSEQALNAGWVGPFTLANLGSTRSVAEGCAYLLTQRDGVVYDIYCVTEPEPGKFVSYYG